MKMIQRFVTNKILGNFFTVSLTTSESNLAHDAILLKYSIALQRSIVSGILFMLPAIYFDTNIIVTVLIPITMVAGTAWFSISLANMKKKFDSFGLELTTNLFEAFSISLALLFVIASVSIFQELHLGITIPFLENNLVLKILAAAIALFIMANIVYKIFIGSIKYDMNDSMLGGQNEIAERYYKKSLSLLHNLSDSLRKDISKDVANYQIGVAFYEVFSFISQFKVDTSKIAECMKISNKLIYNPSIGLREANDMSAVLIEAFLGTLDETRKDLDFQKSVNAIKDELTCIMNNEEGQTMSDTRLGVVFAEIADILESSGELAFKKH